MAESGAPSGLHARVLGPFELDGIDLHALTSRKARTLLKRLALAGGAPVSVDHLVECLWTDADPFDGASGSGRAPARPARPEREVAVNASRARAVVGADRLVRDDAGYRLLVDRLDLQELVELDDRARALFDGGDVAAARTAAAAALALLRGPLLADEADPRWADAERAEVERRAGSLRRLVAEAALAAGDLAVAAGAAGEALDHDPYDEGALRALMAAQAGSGRPASALAAYAGFRERLVDDLGVSPSAVTESLHGEILRDPDALVVAASLRSSVPAGATPPGREDAFAALTAAYDAIGARPRVVVVEGEAGSGKTTLLDAFAGWCRSRGAVVLPGRCDEQGLDLPLQAVGDALADHLATCSPDERDRLLGEDRALLAAVLGLDAVAAPAVTPSPLPDDELRRAELFGAMARVLRGLAGSDCVVLLLDDGHRAGGPTLAWLRTLPRAIDLSLLAVVARRPQARDGSDAATVVLEPLDRDAAGRVVGDDLAEELIDASGGNLLFLVELAAHRRRSASGTDRDLPASLRAAVAAQLADLGTAADSLRAAATLGREVDLDLLAGALGRPPLDVLGDLELGLDRRILVEGGRGIAFRHDLVREVLEGELSSARRALLHRAAVAALRARPGTVEALVLAHHARLAGDVGVAADALAAAAEQSAARFDLDEAVELVTEAIGYDDRADLRLARARLLIARGDLDAADEDGIEARRLGSGAEALALRAWVARHRHDMAAAIRLGDEGIRTSADDETRTSCLLVVGLAHRGIGDLRAADAELSGALAAAGADEAAFRGWLGVLRVHQGRPTEGLALLEPAVGAEAGGLHGFWVEHVLQMTAHAYAMTGRVADALAVLDRLERELRRRGSEVRYAGLVANYRGWILRQLGDPTADAYASVAMASTGLPEPKVQAALDIADGHLAGGRWDDALTSLDEADDLARVRWFSNRWRCEQRSMLLRARWGLGVGDRDTLAVADERAAALVVDCEARGEIRYATLGRLALARARARQGGPTDLDRVAEDLQRLPSVAALEAWWVTAELAHDLGVTAWSTLAEQRAAELALHAGDHVDRFEEHARRVLAALAAR